MNFTSITLAIIFIILIIWAGKTIMNQPTSFTPEWQERFNDIEKFNQFSADNPVELKKIIIDQPQSLKVNR